MNAGRIVAATREDVMDEVAVNAAVAVLERMNIDESEGEHGGGDDGVQMLLGAPVESDHALGK